MHIASYTLCGHHWEESSSISFTPLHQECRDTNWIAWLFCLVDWAVPALSASSQMSNTLSKSLTTCTTLCWTQPKHVHTSCLWGKLRTVLGTPDVSHQCWVEGKITFPLSTDTAFPDAAQETDDWLRHDTARTLVAILLFTTKHRSVSAKSNSEQSAPSLCWCMGAHPSSRPLHLPLSSSVSFLLTHFSRLADLQHNHQMHQPVLPVLCHLQTSGGYTVPSLRSLMKMLNSICLSVNPSDWTPAGLHPTGHSPSAQKISSFQSTSLSTYLACTSSAWGYQKRQFQQPC